jgi:vacuole morphology and inheritance protein 14
MSSPIRQSAVAANQNLFKLILEIPTAAIVFSAPIPSQTPDRAPKESSVVSSLASAFSLTSLATPASEPAAPLSSKGTGSSLTPVHQSDPFDYQATVDTLVLQFMNDHEETRVASLEWLLMLHKKAPKKVRTLSWMLCHVPSIAYFLIFWTDPGD